MKVGMIKSWSAFNQLENEWNQLLAHSDDNSIFLSWEWVSSWQRLYGSHYQPFVATIRDNENSLVGIAPLYLTRMLFLKALPYRLLLVMGSEGVGSDYASFICHRKNSKTICLNLIQALLNERKEWDCIWLTRAKGWNQNHKAFTQLLAENSNISFMKQPLKFPVLHLAPDTQSFEQSLSKNMRSNLKKIQNRISNYEVTLCKNEEEVSTYLETLYDLHAKRWQTLNDKGAFKKHPQLKTFYDTFVPLALRKGWLRFYQLRADGVPQATQIGYLYNQVFYVIQEGFNPAFHQGVGNLLRFNAIKKTIAEGVTEYDFLLGASTHKSRWTQEIRNGYHIFIWNNNKRNIPFKSNRIWPSGRLLSY